MSQMRTTLASTAMLIILAVSLATRAAEPTGAPADTRADTFSGSSVRDDFDALYAGLKAAHYDLFARRSQAEYDALHARMRAQFDQPMTALAVQRTFQRFVAFGRIAHANIAFPSEFGAWRESGGRIFPLMLRVVGNDVVVSDVLGPVEGIARGDVILAIEGQPIATWLHRLGAHLSADTEHMRNTLMENRFPALLWLELGEREAFEVQRRSTDGTEASLRVPALGREQGRSAAVEPAPRFELDWDRREARMLAHGIAWLRPGPFYDNRPDAPHPWNTEAFFAFVDSAFAQFLAAGARALIIDLRSNPGGDNSFSDHLLAWFADRPFRFASSFRIRSSLASAASNAKRLTPDAPADSMSRRLATAYAEHPPGEVFEFPLPLSEPRDGSRFTPPVYVLVDRHTYSNAANVAAIVQDYGFATVLGEETSDLATTYGAMEHFTLPATGIVVGYPKALIIRPSGDTTPRGVVPDVPLPPAPVDATRDVVLDLALARINDDLGQDSGNAPVGRTGHE